jgi:hypothetical protein
MTARPDGAILSRPEAAMLALAALTALALASPDAPAPFGGKLPYPAPRATAVTAKTKCDLGTVAAVDAAASKLQVTTPAKLVTFKVGPEVQVFDQDGRALGNIGKLTAGQKARVYYVVDDEARASEVDLE